MASDHTTPAPVTAAPLWLLDVDGVLNAVCQEPTADHVVIRCNGFRITYRPALIERINRLHGAGLVDIHWLTTWCHDAAAKIAPALGLPEFEVEGVPEYERAHVDPVWWKAITVRRLVEGDPERALIWTDDDCGYANRIGELDWLADHPNKLVISPKVHTGITDAHMDEIEARCGAVFSV